MQADIGGYTLTDYKGAFCHFGRKKRCNYSEKIFKYLLTYADKYNIVKV